jgi:hypothetical protein
MEIRPNRKSFNDFVLHCEFKTYTIELLDNNGFIVSVAICDGYNTIIIDGIEND